MNRREFINKTAAASIVGGTAINTSAQIPIVQNKELIESKKSPKELDTQTSQKILSYKPNQQKIAAKFRKWHVESLLNQAADLIERCALQLKEYRSLDFSWTQLEIDLKSQNAELKLDQDRKDVFERDLIQLREKETFFKNTDEFNAKVIIEADKLYDFDTREGQGQAGWTKAGQNKNEKHIEDTFRSLDKTQTTKQIEWLTADVKYKQALLDIRSVNNSSKNQNIMPGQAFSLKWQRDLVGEKLQRDYEDAYDRTLIAEKGLDEIYGFKKNPATPPDNLTTMDERITYLTNWVRNSIEWLVSFQQLDQAFTRVISIKSILEEEAWEAIIAADDIYEGRIRIPNSLFSGHEFVRLRGIGASLLGKKDKKVGVIPWSILLSVPKQAQYLMNGNLTKIEQTDMPKCLLGRVENREVYRPLEICGMISLMNASPIGQPIATGISAEDGMWGIDIMRPQNSPERFEKLDDIILEINVVGIPNNYAINYL